jgi:tetratricopeptide (TPR) repeat protein
MALFDPLKVYGSGLVIDSVPCIIREILYAPPCPSEEIAKLLEVALMHHNTSHYQLALQTYLRAQKSWMELEFKKRKQIIVKEMERKKQIVIEEESDEAHEKIQKIEDAYADELEVLANTELLTPLMQMFLRCAIGSVYESSGNDELALGEYMEARKYSMKLDPMNPDQAIPYSCIGSVFVHLNQYDMAYQYYLRARELRESVRLHMNYC